MALTVPNEGEVQILNLLTNKVAGASLTIDLFSSNTNPTGASVLADFTLVTGGGYAANVIANTGWTVTGGAPSFANAAPVVWTFTSVPADPNVFGYIIHTNNSKVVAAERFPVGIAPFIISAAGETVTVTPVVTAGSVVND
jgi:hypothetical protein